MEPRRPERVDRLLRAARCRCVRDQRSGDGRRMYLMWLRRRMAIAAVMALAVSACAHSVQHPKVPDHPLPPATGESLVAVGSARKVCQLTGEMDRQIQPPQPTVSQTRSRFGLVGTDNGYSFEHDGRIWFLFGDSVPSPRFSGAPNGDTDPPRSP